VRRETILTISTHTGAAARMADIDAGGLTRCIADGVCPLGPALREIERTETDEMKGTVAARQLDSSLARS